MLIIPQPMTSTERVQQFRRSRGLEKTQLLRGALAMTSAPAAPRRRRKRAPAPPPMPAPAPQPQDTPDAA